MPNAFYDSLAAIYHLIFPDWDGAVRWQGEVLRRLLPPPEEAGCVLDCACGIGTQALALAGLGYRVEGSDVSAESVARARREATARGLDVTFRTDDMRSLATAPPGRYGALVCLDNAVPHLESDDENATALRAMHDRLRPGGTLLLTLRDYAALMAERPAVQGPRFHGEAGARRIVHQVWDWRDARHHTLHLYLTWQEAGAWQSRHFASELRAVTSDEVAALATRAGFDSVAVVPAADSGYYQPLVRARRPAA